MLQTVTKLDEDPLLDAIDRLLAARLIEELPLQDGDDFYSFEGLRAFKQKFGPVWTPRYMTCPGGMSMFRTLVDVAMLISRPRLPFVRGKRTS